MDAYTAAAVGPFGTADVEGSVPRTAKAKRARENDTSVLGAGEQCAP